MLFWGRSLAIDTTWASQWGARYKNKQQTGVNHSQSAFPFHSETNSPHSEQALAGLISEEVMLEEGTVHRFMYLVEKITHYRA